MITVSGLFDKRGQARIAIDALEEAGISRDNISLISPSNSKADDDGESTGAAVGAAVGGAGGLLAGLVGVATIGVGPVVGVGWLATSLAGAAVGGVAGGLIGSMVSAGIDETDAHVYAEGVKRGGTLVSARVDEIERDNVRDILAQNLSVDIASRRRAYEESGWEGFNDEYVSNDELLDSDRPLR